MSEDKKRKTETDKARRRFEPIRLVLVGVVVVVIVFCLAWVARWWDFRSVDEKLAAIEAELAIPDSENAAIGYMKFFADPDNTTVLGDIVTDTPSAYAEPWADSEYPELAAKLEANQALIQTLLDISMMERARFPIDIGPGTDSMLALAYVRRATFILSWAAANDLVEGRIDAAYSKYRCQLKLARHLQQQPATVYDLVGMSVEAVASGNIRRAVMRDEITSEQLNSLEKILDIPRSYGHADAAITARVDRLIDKKNRIRDAQGPRLPLVQRFKLWWRLRSNPKQRARNLRLIRLRLEATRRATPILLALARYKEETNRWPETLEHIQPKLPEQMLTDPQNNGPFVYERDGDSFIFYSKGPNGIDEGGSSSRPADDWPIWPLKIKTIPSGGEGEQ